MYVLVWWWFKISLASNSYTQCCEFTSTSAFYRQKLPNAGAAVLASGAHIKIVIFAQETTL